MGVGGQLGRSHREVQACLVRAYTGVRPFEFTGWNRCRAPAATWVLDYLNHGRQRQRIGGGRTFIRLSGVAALYAPATRYDEWWTKGITQDESFILFDPRGELASLFRRMAGRRGYAHLRDPDNVIGAGLRELGELVFHRQPGFHVFAHGLLLQLIGKVLTAEQTAIQSYVVHESVEGDRTGDLRSRLERCVRAHITERLQVGDLAKHLHMSASALAHAYPRMAGESPHRTVARLKIQAAKELLLQNNLAVKEVAYRLGFSNEFQFSRAFKRVEGLSPKHYFQALTRKTKLD